MLQLKNIVKTYVTGDLTQDALSGVSVSFRENEFVSILGPSGSGKTTMLNIIGGLDRYNSGDLVINGVSTREYKDSDWDYYRNNSIGFVFQSYNLIPHQSVLANVEMALTLAGVSRKERRERAVAVLKKVGLADHIHKKPNQMSGGQMQRVAIARALINNPDILLADEPTGALDSETSVQIMELLKEIAKDKLVIMVTHNPELAEAYSTRIVRLKDGKILSDSNPYDGAEVASVPKTRRKISMSFLTALSLSFNNLRTKKGRTLLTSFAGSIGIIGIALILALSTGMNAYIASVQKETMASYPITITSEALDMSGMMGVRAEIIGERRDEMNHVTTDREGVYANYTQMELTQEFSTSIVENNLTEFKKYLDDPDSEIQTYVGENGVIYSYDVSFQVYSRDPEGNLVNTDAETEDAAGGGFAAQSTILDRLGTLGLVSGSSGAANFSELMPGANGQTISPLITDSYDVLYGYWPESAEDVVLVLDRENSLSATTLYQLGLITREQLDQVSEQIRQGEEPEEWSFSYADICNHKFYLVPDCDRYEQQENGTFLLVEEDTMAEASWIEQALELNITGIIRAKADGDSANITTAVAYTSALTDYVISRTDESPVVLAQQEDPTINVLTGMNFESLDDEAKAEDAKTYLSGLGVSEKASFYQLMQYYAAQSGDMGQSETGAAMTQQSDIPMDEQTMAAVFDQYLAGEPDQAILLRVYDQYLAGGSYEENLKAFGKVSYDAPASISIYTDSFENKDAISECISRYNETASEDGQITYTDYVAMLTSSITTIINGISYVLIAFVAISLVVSCIMIGIITHISVMERTKEIGILRALGASKGNISQVFNAETFIVGCCAGLLGIGVSWLALIPINSIITGLSGIPDLKAQLPVESSVILVLISIVITILGGLLPAKKAAKKDPVIALRTE